jgi:hypothetical protein
VRTGVSLLIMLTFAVAHVARVKDVTVWTIVTFGLAVAIGAANWKKASIALAVVVLWTTGMQDMRQLAMRLAPLGLGLVVGVGLQKGKKDERAVEPVRAIPVDRERGAHPGAPARSGRARLDGYDEYAGVRRSDGRSSRHHDADDGQDGRWTDHQEW